MSIRTEPGFINSTAHRVITLVITLPQPFPLACVTQSAWHKKQERENLKRGEGSKLNTKTKVCRDRETLMFLFLYIQCRNMK